MARTRSLSSIKTEISKVTAELQKAQEKVDELTQRLLELQEQKQSIDCLLYTSWPFTYANDSAINL